MAAIGAIEGDIVEVLGKRRAVAKCKPLEPADAIANPNTVWLTNTVRNNAEVPLGASVEVKKAARVSEAKRIVITSSYDNELSKNLPHLGITQHLPSMLSGSPILPGDYVVTHHPMGSSIVFEVVEVEADDGVNISFANIDSASPVLISTKTIIEIKGAERLEQSGQRSRRGYPVFWVNVQDGVRKSNENIFLVMSFWGLHFGGRYSGNFERKIAKDTDIQRLVLGYTEAASKEMDAINEESKSKPVSSDEVKNRILQRWMAV